VGECADHGQVVSDEADHLYLYKHADKLDAVSRTLKLTPFLGICDTTDLRFNTQDLALPAGMRSTDGWMAAQGAWMPAVDAANYLRSLHDHIVQKNLRFGLLSNQQAQVLAELDEVMAFVAGHVAQAEKFNVSVVM
jgi:hypothetical protein